MFRFVTNFCKSLWSFLGVVFTGGKYGDSVPSPHSYEYAKWQEKKQKAFEKFGTHTCKNCSTKIPGNQSLCGSCYYRYVKK